MKTRWPYCASGTTTRIAPDTWASTPGHPSRGLQAMSCTPFAPLATLPPVVGIGTATPFAIQTIEPCRAPQKSQHKNTPLHSRHAIAVGLRRKRLRDHALLQLRQRLAIRPGADLFLRMLDARETRDAVQAEMMGVSFSPRCARLAAGSACRQHRCRRVRSEGREPSCGSRGGRAHACADHRQHQCATAACGRCTGLVEKAVVVALRRADRYRKA